MRTEPAHGVFWDDRRKNVVRQLLADGYDRDMICMRLGGISRMALRSAIQTYDLDKPEQPHG